jgi:toxin ParE1/3/4
MSLENFPRRGTVRDRVLLGLRIIGFGRGAAIAFRVTDDTVESQGIPAWPGHPDRLADV